MLQPSLWHFSKTSGRFAAIFLATNVGTFFAGCEEILQPFLVTKADGFFCVILATEVVILNRDNGIYCCLLYCDNSSYFSGNNTVHSNSNHYTLLTLTK